MRKFYILLFFIVFINCCLAQELIIHKTDGSTSTYPISEIDSITFSLEDIIFYDDFESGNISGYSIPLGHTPPIISTVASYSPTRSISLVAPRSSFSTMGMDLLEPATSNVFGISCKMMKNSLSDSSAFALYIFQGSVIPNDNQMDIGFIQDSIFIYASNESNLSEYLFAKVDVIEINRWYTFTIEHNFATHTSSFFIDNTKIYETTLTISSIDNFYFGDWSSEWYPNINESLFIDDLKVYKR